jgi:chloramphenicol-sensitive protein RarD
MSGVWYGVAAYGIWGLFPLYWRLFPDVPALQILGHRIVWSFVVLLGIVASSWRPRAAVFASVTWRSFRLYAVAASLIGVNWFLYVYAVNAGFVVETSLGYFIAPLVNVLLGVVVFRERLRPLQWLAVALVCAGVVRLTVAYGGLPWIAISLAVSFGTYGLVKKKAPLPSLEGLTVETAVLVIPAAAFLLLRYQEGAGAFLAGAATTDALLVAGGAVTVAPLLLFASAVRRIPLTLVGILQYIAPTIQFVLGVFVFGEPFSRTQLSGFALVWFGLVVFGLDSVRLRPAPSLVVAGDAPGS